MRKQSACIVMAAAFAAMICAGQVNAGHSDVTIESVTRTSFEVESAEGRGIFAWIRMHATEYAPLTHGGRIELVSTVKVSGDATMRVPGSMPPVPLPANGQPGQSITISVTGPGGALESWSFTWQAHGKPGGGGSWAMTGYDYKKGNLNQQ